MSTKEDYQPILPSVRALLDGLFDYAGLFPPASLSLEKAAREYDLHRRGGNAWMAGPFVVPVAQLPELARQKYLLDPDRPLRLDVLPRSASSGVELEQSLEEDLTSVRHFMETTSGASSLEAMELRFPMEDLESDDAAASVAEILLRSVADVDLVPGSVFLELGRRPSLEADLVAFFDALSNARNEAFLLGAKWRCGGERESAYPTTREFARFIHMAVERKQAFKLTAGLHHPVRHQRKGVWMHGFLNAVFATVLARTHELDMNTIDQIFQDTSADSFRFTEEGMAWQDLEASMKDLEDARATLLLSIGSCSFNEPREDLAQLGWLV